MRYCYGVIPTSHRRSQEFVLRPEGPKFEASREEGMSSWGGDSEPPPHQLGGMGECCKLPQRGPGSCWGSLQRFPRYAPEKFAHTSMFTMSRSSDDHVLLTMYPAELK